MNDTPITFGTLPSKKRRNGAATNRDLAIVDQLRARPQEWAHIATRANISAAGELARRIKRGGTVAFQPASAFEAVSRTVDGEYRVYARYVGTTPTGDPQ